MKKTQAAEDKSGLREKHTEPIDLGHGISARVVVVTKEVAERWLKKNHPDNRAIRQPFVEALVRDQQMGDWRLTHQGAAFDSEDRLIDGQHRLSAIVQSGIACPMLVVWNKVSEFHDPIDRGRPRSMATVTGIKTRDIAALTVLRGLSAGYFAQQPVTVAEVDDLYGKYGEDLALIHENTRASHKLPGGVLAATAWGLPVDRAKALEFIHQVSTGEMIARGQPSYALRRWLEDAGKKLTSRDHAMAAMSCLFAHFHNKGIIQVYVTEKGYRRLTGARRAKKVPYTPGTELVPSENRNDDEEEAS
jgi:hypothetical protein